MKGVWLFLGFKEFISRKQNWEKGKRNCIFQPSIFKISIIQNPWRNRFFYQHKFVVSVRATLRKINSAAFVLFTLSSTLFYRLRAVFSYLIQPWVQVKKSVKCYMMMKAIKNVIITAYVPFLLIPWLAVWSVWFGLFVVWSSWFGFSSVRQILGSHFANAVHLLP